ncbi:unnamed protein product [Chilo suppressalis]|uniref:ascorbate ferrireductase (transmembrane) n=1 Tax=Chilo suppressalis TaxID=168631 RepID=A0ABN8B029_CHISP|nr:hypothetical protein evm_011572 [Chilo suppressalis]CAH0399990.1 unnamed protein product [Chilo suppressalis]
MNPNANEVNVVAGNLQNGSKDQQFTTPKDQVVLKTSRSLSTLVVHVLIGFVVGVSIVYSLRNGLPLGATAQHIVLCLIGFQLMMAESILALAPDSWLSSLKLRHKRLVHWVMQVLGSVLALAGTIIQSLSREVNFYTLHGQFGLVAMVFSVACLFNGIASLYVYELRNILPGTLSKLTHICFGIIAFATASISLCYGFDKNGFRTWATSGVADTLIIMTVIFTLFIIINPFITFYNKFRAAVSK